VRPLCNSTPIVVQDLWSKMFVPVHCPTPVRPTERARLCSWAHLALSSDRPGVRTIYDGLFGRIQYLPRPQSSGGTTRTEHWIARLVNTVLGSRFKTIGTQRDSDNACAERCF
jgi:hypothetical protein